MDLKQIMISMEMPYRYRISGAFMTMASTYAFFCPNATIFVDFGYDRCFVLSLFIRGKKLHLIVFAKKFE